VKEGDVPDLTQIQSKILQTEINLFASFETVRLPTVCKGTVNYVVLSVLIVSVS
jgi:hypothetical protein